jgi:hypothetical protein
MWSPRGSKEAMRGHCRAVRGLKRNDGTGIPNSGGKSSTFAMPHPQGDQGHHEVGPQRDSIWLQQPRGLQRWGKDGRRGEGATEEQRPQKHKGIGVQRRMGIRHQPRRAEECQRQCRVGVLAVTAIWEAGRQDQWAIWPVAPLGNRRTEKVTGSKANRWLSRLTKRATSPRFGAGYFSGERFREENSG